MSTRGRAWVVAGVAVGLMLLIAVDAWNADYRPDRLLARALAAGLAIGVLGVATGTSPVKGGRRVSTPGAGRPGPRSGRHPG